MNYLDHNNSPCTYETIRLALSYKLITGQMEERLLKEIKSGKRKLTIPILNENAFNIYKKNNLEHLIKKVPEELKKQYQESTEILWRLDQDADSIFASISEDIDECLSSIIINFGVEGLYQRSKVLTTRLKNLKESQEKVIKANNNAQNFINNHAKEDDNYQKKKERLEHTNRELITLEKNKENLNNQLSLLTANAELLESYAIDMKDYYEDLELFILSSGKNPFSWERLNAGSCTCGESSWINRDYNSSHNESSVLNNFINHPATFYLFVEFGGFERGYARGSICNDNNKVFLKCEALHAKNCKHVQRNNNDNSIAELGLIAGMMKLTHEIGLNELRWAKVGVSRDYGMQIKNGKKVYTPVELYF